MGRITRFLTIYAKLLVIFMVQKPLFMAATHASSQMTWTDLFCAVPAVVYHGLPLDLAMAGYLAALPGLLLLSAVWIKEDFVRPVLNGYYAFIALAIAFCFVLNTALYPYWGFPLDTTPFYYFFTSPKDALASVSFLFIVAGIAGMAILAFLIWWILKIRSPRRDRYGRRDYRRSMPMDKHRILTSVILLVLTALLIIPIRGGLSVSTNNTGKAYFSQKAFLNHAAVNPMFSLFEAIDHQEDFSSMYRFMDPKEADKIFSSMVSTSDANTYPLLNETARKGAPDILLVVMEGFASDLMQSLGGTYSDVAIQLDSITRQGILFTRFYANSFRTDRGLVSILSGYPAQPTTSIMRYPAKAAALPSLVRSLQNSRHYRSAYYYGGDVDFAFQRSYLVSQGFEKIVSEDDFPASQRLSKWGVYDHVVADKMMNDIEHEQHDKGPVFRVLQTSSSHEPFDVPYSRLKDKHLNAFAYTDSVMGDIVRRYSRLPRWKNTLVIFVPDHVGSYKEILDNGDRSRYQIPLILAGGAITRPMKVGIIGSQQDIAATLLGQFGIQHNEFTFSKNMMSDATPKFAFFTVNDAFGVVSEENSFIYDNKLKKAVYDKGPQPGYNQKRGMAYLQKLYDDISSK